MTQAVITSFSLAIWLMAKGVMPVDVRLAPGTARREFVFDAEQVALHKPGYQRAARFLEVPTAAQSAVTHPQEISTNASARG